MIESARATNPTVFLLFQDNATFPFDSAKNFAWLSFLGLVWTKVHLKDAYKE
jgi:hypothetical protein